MGFELIFHYYDRKEDGNGYNTDVPQTFTKNIGKGTEEVADSKVSGVILSQLARRDIFVNDVEVCEVARRKVSFKETKGGVILRNRKYSFEAGTAILIEEEPQQEQIVPQPTPSAKQVVTDTPLRWERFQPDEGYIPELRHKKIPLTVNQKYPIIREEVIPQSVGGEMEYQTSALMYVVIADNGKQITMHSCHFVPITKGLYGIDFGPPSVAAASVNRSSSSNLTYMDSNSRGVGGMDMPNLRR